MDPVFHRVELALDMTTRLLDPPATSAVRSGLFLSASRRTGKSTSLREDLVPALGNAGALVLYVDLWRERGVDPGEVIVDAVAAAVAGQKGAWRRVASRIGNASLSVGSVSVSLGRREAGTALKAALEQEVAMANEATLDLVRSLRPLPSAVLREVASRGRDYAPFEGRTMKRYARWLERIDAAHTIEPSATNVQAALKSLKQRGLVWRASRGVYALEEMQLAELMRGDGMPD